MALDPDAIVDRRRLRRRVSFWRFLAIVLVVGLAGALFMQNAGEGWTTRTPHVARFKVDGFIAGDNAALERLNDIAESSSVRALVVVVDSPGGTTAGAEALYGAIRKVAENKPVVAVVDTLAASGGYIAALGADRIVARGNSLVGSIGVLFQWPEAGDLLRRLGVNVYEVKSTPLKAAPNFFEPPSEEAEAMLETLVADTYDWFVDLVADRRGMADGAARSLGDGRVFTGRQALAEQLIDETGGEAEARAWLAAEHGIPADMRIREWRPRSQGWGSGITTGAARWALETVGLGSLVPLVERSRALSLDGLLSVWHPPTPASRDRNEGRAR